ncbi:MAG: hypothetical protein ACR2FN_02215 [Chitinophagaceae bacterium]
MNRSLIFCLISFCYSSIFISCQKEYSLENGNLNAIATGSLQKDSLGNCLPDSVFGTLHNGVTPGDTNYVQVQVNVTAIGNYLIKTNVQNGFQFADSGFFATTGINTIKLKALGTPILPIITDFVVSFDSSICAFSVNVKDSTGTGLGGDTTNPNTSDTAWKFTAQAGTSGLTTYNGPIVLAKTFDTTLQSQIFKILEIEGVTPATGDSAFFVGLILPDSTTITPQQYSTQTIASFYFVNAITQVPIYSADPTTSGFIVNVQIISYDAVNKIVTGTLTGNATDSGGNSIAISLGSFKAKVTWM